MPPPLAQSLLQPVTTCKQKLGFSKQVSLGKQTMGVMPSSRWQRENELSGNFEGSFSSNILSGHCV